MAEIRDELVLDIDQALRDITRVEQALDRSLAPVELRIDVDDTAVQRVEDSLRDVRTVAEDTTDQVRLTADEYREVARAIETGVTPARAIAEATGQVRTQADLAEADFRDLARVLNISEDAARDLTKEFLDSEQAAERLEDAVRDVARQLDLSEDDANRLSSSLREADRAAAGINTRGGTLVTTFGNLRSVVGGIAGALAVVGGGQILSAAIRGAQTALTEFQNLNESINAVNVTFGTAAGTVLEFGNISAQVAGLSAAAFQQAVVPIGSVLTNFGFNAIEAADASIILVQRAADLASVFNTDVATALAAINSALVGQVEPLRRYGAEISQARVEQFALASGIAASRGELDLQALTAARVQLILQDTAKVQGDFASTSDELANAQRIAAAEAQNFAAEVGEALAPAMAALVAILPELLDGLRQLVPGFANAADSAAVFFQSIGQDGGAGFRTFGASANFAVGTLADVGSALFDAGQAVVAVFDPFASMEDQFLQFDASVGRIISKQIGTRLARTLDAGVDAADAFAEAIVAAGRSFERVDIFSGSFRDFSIQAGLTKEELFEVTGQLIEAGAAAGLSAPEIEFLTDQYNILRNTLTNFAAEGDKTRFIGEIGESLPAAAARFTTFSGELATARTTITQTLQGIADDAAGQQDRLLDALDPFAELPEQINLSAEEATAALVAQFEAIAAFEADIIRLAADAPNLALELFQKGPAAADLVEDFLDTPALIEEAENALRGVATAGVNALTEELENDLVKAGLNPSTAAQFAALFTNSNVITEVTEAGIRAGATGAGGYIQGVLDEAAAREVDARTTLGRTVSAVFDQEEITEPAGESTAESFLTGIIGFDLLTKMEGVFAGLGLEVDLTEEGAFSGATYIGGMQEAIAARADALKTTITTTLDTAIQRDSPPKLFLDAGKDSGDAFWMGFEQANLSLRSPVSAITGSIAGTSTTATSVVEGGFTFAPTVINPTVQDLETTLARQGQLFGAVSGALGRVGRALPK